MISVSQSGKSQRESLRGSLSFFLLRLLNPLSLSTVGSHFESSWSANILLFLSSSLFFVSVALFFQAVVSFFFPSSRAKKPSCPYIHLSIPFENSKNHAVHPSNFQFPQSSLAAVLKTKQGATVGGERRSSSLFPREPWQQWQHQPSPASTLLIRTNQSHKVSNFNKEKLVTKHQRRGGGGGGGVDRVREKESQSLRVCRRCLAKSKTRSARGLFR